MERTDVYLYLRFTADKKENQRMEREVNAFLSKFNKYVVIKKFTDNPDSEDTGLIELMNLLRIEMRVKRIIAYSRSNVSKDEIFVMWIEKEFFKYDTTLRFITDEYFQSNELEVFRERVIGAFARYEKDKLPNKLAAHREYKSFRSGVKASGNCPLGYRYSGKTSKDKTIIVIKNEAELVKQLYEKYISLKSLGLLKEYCDNNNIVSRRGKKFSRQALYNILVNQFYIGLLSYNQYKYIGIKGSTRKRAILIQERRIVGKHERIIPKELFEQVKALLEENNKHKND
ncbi:MAG: recombinase family protein [bacterium]